MLELQRIQFAGWALTEGQHRPKAGKKKKTREAGLFFLVFVLKVCLGGFLFSLENLEKLAFFAV